MYKNEQKLYYKLEILYNKWSPFIISGILFIYHVLKFLFTWDLEWVQYLCLPSMFTTIHMYNSRQTFYLCKVHRCFVNYVLANILVSIIEHYWIEAYQNIYWFIFIISGTLLAILIGLFYYNKEHEKINSGFTQKNCR